MFECTPLRTCLTFFTWALLAAGVAGAQTTWYVDDNAPGDPGPGDPTISDPLEDGSAEHPFDAIQEGIDAATDGDTVLVADGTYTGVGNKNLDYAGKAITVRSENGPDTCVIDCENDSRGFHFHSGETADSIVEGFTVTNGDHGILCVESSPAIGDCTITGNAGAGISCWGGDPTITGCTITQNTGGWAGGIELFNGSATISNCLIADNAGIHYGGGIGCECADVTITECTITGNSVAGSHGHGGGVACLYGSAIVTDSTIADNAGGGLYFDDNDHIIENCTISENTTDGSGGGIYCVDVGNLTITNCTISKNSVEGSGGAIYCEGVGNLAIANCTIMSNSAGTWDPGGGVCCMTDGDVVVTGCTISGNTAGVGGGVCYSGDGDLVVADCTISENSVEGSGGGVKYAGGGRLTISNCTITHNAAASNGPGLGGGGVRCSGEATIVNSTISGNTARLGGGIYCSGHSSIANCEITANQAYDYGGGLMCRDSTAVANCTIAGNTAVHEGGGVQLSGDDLSITNSILWDNVPSQIHGSSAVVTYCDVQDGWPGEGNTDADPLFVYPNDADYHLSAGSPCIDAGCNCNVPWDLVDLDGDGVLLEYVPFDLDGEGRFFDDPDTLDTGSGVPPIVDMGAYEFGGSDLPPCYGDLDGDRDVDLADLAELLGHYGMTSGATGADGDMDCDGDIEIADLAELLGVYGNTCP